MAAEATQEKGRRGVERAKRWLEATTYLELQFNVYQHEAMCEVEHLNGVKRFDMYGFFLGPDRREVFVENKDYKAEEDLYAQFQEFLAVAYSATAHSLKGKKTDRKTEFMWVTTHPFRMARWAHLATPEEIQIALKKHADFLKGESIDDDLVRTVADRIWVLVLNERQLEISLTHTEVLEIMPKLKRKEPTL